MIGTNLPGCRGWTRGASLNVCCRMPSQDTALEGGISVLCDSGEDFHILPCLRLSLAPSFLVLYPNLTIRVNVILYVRSHGIK